MFHFCVERVFAEMTLLKNLQHIIIRPVNWGHLMPKWFGRREWQSGIFVGWQRRRRIRFGWGDTTRSTRGSKCRGTSREGSHLFYWPFWRHFYVYFTFILFVTWQYSNFGTFSLFNLNSFVKINFIHIFFLLATLLFHWL